MVLVDKVAFYTIILTHFPRSWLIGQKSGLDQYCMYAKYEVYLLCDRKRLEDGELSDLSDLDLLFKVMVNRSEDEFLPVLYVCKM